MAEPRQARVLVNLADQTRGALLALQLESHPELVLQGGKYIIINTGLENTDGKLIKRAYSLFAVKPEEQQFFLAAEPVTDGIASRYLRSLQSGDVITFSGPWGRFHWPAEAREKTVIAAAFGSGITGILGYLTSVPDDCRVELYWYKDVNGGLLSDETVQECAQGFELQIHHRTMTDDPILDLQNAAFEARYIAAGEGIRVERFLDFLRERGVPEDRKQSEVFYRSTQDLSHAKADR